MCSMAAILNVDCEERDARDNRNNNKKDRAQCLCPCSPIEMDVLHDLLQSL
jgi:hypothetical protein